MIGFIKQDFVKKGGLTKTFLIKRGVGAKGGGLEQFRILRGVGGGLAKKSGVTFLGKGGGGFIPWCPLWELEYHFFNN